METAPRNCRFLSLVVVERVLILTSFLPQFNLRSVGKSRTTVWKPRFTDSWTQQIPLSAPLQVPLLVGPSLEYALKSLFHTPPPPQTSEKRKVLVFL